MSNVGTAIVAPTLGTIFCFGMFASPLMAVLQVRKTKTLGVLNPIPFGVTIFNCIAWIIYGCQKRDLFIFFANGSGLIFGFYYCVSVIPYIPEGDETTPDKKYMKLIMEFLVMGSVVFWTMISLFVFIVLDTSKLSDLKIGQTIVSSFGIIGGLSYYGSPLSSMYSVIKLKDSSSLHTPMIITNLAAAFLWFIYGLIGNPDVMIWIPNMLGSLLSLSQLTLSFMYHPLTLKQRLIRGINIITALFTGRSIVTIGDGINNSETGQKQGWNDTEPGGNVDVGHGSGRSHNSGNGSGNSSGRGLDDSGVYYDDNHVSSDVIHDNDGHQFNEDIHYRRASAPTVIHYSDFDDEDVVIVGTSGNGEVGNPLWINANDNAH